MRRFMILFGTVFAVIILLSGSAVAPPVWHFADHVEVYVDCTNPNEIVGAPDDSYATLGVDGPPQTLGYIVVDLETSGIMGPNQAFIVFADSPVTETYYVIISADVSFSTSYNIGYGYDDNDETFYTPITPLRDWRYVMLIGISGDATQWVDPIYGPDIDAVGWYG